MGPELTSAQVEAELAADILQDPSYITQEEPDELENPEAELELILSEIGKVAADAIPVPPTLKDRFTEKFANAKTIAEVYHKDWSDGFEQYRVVGSFEDFKTHGYARINFARLIINALIDSTYMQNPHVELTALDNSSTDIAEVLQLAVKNLTNKFGKRRLNLKSSVLKAILYSIFTNLGVVRLNFQDQEDSLEDLQMKYQATMERLRETEDITEAGRLYELLDLINKKLEFNNQFGVQLKHISPFNFYVDEDATQPDLSDASIVFEREHLSEDRIKADFLIYNAEEGAYYLKHKPSVRYSTLVEKPITRTAEQERAAIVDEIMKDEEETHGKLRRADRVPCIWIFDKLTKMIYLYREDDFENPLWVWEDTLQLSRFFQHFVLSMSSTFTSLYQTGEVSFIFPHQEDINDAARVKQQIKNIGTNNFFYDAQAIEQSEIDKLFSNIKLGRRGNLTGIRLNLRGQSLDQVIKPFMLPIAQNAELLDTGESEKAIYQTSRTTEAMVGGEFKTNTTNRAIESYQQFGEQRSGTIVDKIEDFLEQIIWSTIELIVSKYSKEQIAYILPAVESDKFKSMSVDELNRNFTFAIAAGSIEKPSSDAKKREAMMLLQVIGQFGAGMPETTMHIAMNMIKKITTTGIITKDDFDRLKKEAETVAQKGISTTQPQQPGQPQPQPQPQPQQPTA